MTIQRPSCVSQTKEVPQLAKISPFASLFPTGIVTRYSRQESVSWPLLLIQQSRWTVLWKDINFNENIWHEFWWQGVLVLSLSLKMFRFLSKALPIVGLIASVVSYPTATSNVHRRAISQDLMDQFVRFTKFSFAADQFANCSSPVGATLVKTVRARSC